MSHNESQHLGLHDDDYYLYNRSHSMPARKKSDPGRITAPFKLKPQQHSRSPVLKKKSSLSPDGSVSSLGGGTKHRSPSGGSGGIHSAGMEELDVPLEETMSPSIVLTMEASPGSENSARSPDTIVDDVDGPLTVEQKSRRSTIDAYRAKLEKTRALINQEHSSKESNVNAYLRQAPNVDDQQRQKMKQAFEKQNQKSGQTINQLQKKLDLYQKKIDELERPASIHKSNRLRDVSQGIKDVGANIREGISGLSGGVVGNIKGAKDTIVSKPREFAHLIKNRFGSADNIHSRSNNDNEDEDYQRRSLQYSDDDNSSATSGSNFAPNEGSPQSMSQHNSLHTTNDMLLEELNQQREIKLKMADRLNRLHEEMESYKTESHAEMLALKSLIEEERYRYHNLEEQLNDLTELHQHEITNLRQEIASANEKIEYQLDERIHDTQETLEICSTRVTKMELQQQQQQIISIEGVDNVTFRTILTKLLNVILAVVAVILVFVSTIANMLAPFLLSRFRILTTSIMILTVVFAWKYWEVICVYVRREFNIH